jgi:threonine synthase
MHLICIDCGKEYEPDPTRYCCECGGLLDLVDAPVFDPARIDQNNHTLYRYRHSLPLPSEAPMITLGEGGTPLVETEWQGNPVQLKCEHLNPSGSFKDRGTAVLAVNLAVAGVEEVVEDSSGNAGASLAAYSARAGIKARIYVPAHASPVKQSQIAAYGAEIVRIEGPRTETADAVMRAAQAGAIYASHVYHPLIHQGIKTAAYEICEQLGARLGEGLCPPDTVVLPVGHGSLLLGLALGFKELFGGDHIQCIPRLIGIQVDACPPLATAWANKAKEPAVVVEGDTIAGGIRIAEPVRGRAILSAVRESGGAMLAVGDREALEAQRTLAHQGFYVEPTSAVALAGLSHLQDQLDGTTVVLLTGSGFKTPPTITGGMS